MFCSLGASDAKAAAAFSMACKVKKVVRGLGGGAARCERFCGDDTVAELQASNIQDGHS